MISVRKFSYFAGSKVNIEEYLSKILTVAIFFKKKIYFCTLKILK